MCCALRTSIFDLDDAFKRFFSQQNNYSKFKKKNAYNSHRTNCIRSVYKGNHCEYIKIDLENQTIQLPKLDEIKIGGYRNLKKLDGRKT